jgi:hypothetical protein
MCFLELGTDEGTQMKYSIPRVVAGAWHIALDIFFVELEARLCTGVAPEGVPA